MIATTNYSKRQVIPVFINSNIKFVSPNNDIDSLVKLVQSKSERGFHTLYNKYCGALYGVIIKLVKRRTQSKTQGPYQIIKLVDRNL